MYSSKKIQESIMSLDMTDKGISSDLLIDGVRESVSTNFIKKIVKKLA